MRRRKNRSRSRKDRLRLKRKIVIIKQKRARRRKMRVRRRKMKRLKRRKQSASLSQKIKAASLKMKRKATSLKSKMKRLKRKKRKKARLSPSRKNLKKSNNQKPTKNQKYNPNHPLPLTKKTQLSFLPLQNHPTSLKTFPQKSPNRTLKTQTPLLTSLLLHPLKTTLQIPFLIPQKKTIKKASPKTPSHPKRTSSCWPPSQNTHQNKSQPLILSLSLLLLEDN